MNAWLLLTLAALLWEALHLPYLAAATKAEGTPHSAEAQRLIGAAKDGREAELRISWSGNQFLGHIGAKKFEGVFNRMYGTNIEVNFTPGPSMPDMAARVTQELAAGHKASTDVYLGTESHYGPLVNRDVMEAYDYTRLSQRINKDFLAPRNIGVEVASLIFGITYNTHLISPGEAPKKLEDVLHPRWKGKIASTQHAAIFDRVAMRREWGADKMKAFATKLSEHIGGLIRCGEPLRISSGEFSMMVLDCGSHDARRERARGAPLGHVIPEDASVVGFLYMGVPRNSSHPNLAKLFINMAMSEEGQKVIYDTDFTDHYRLPGSQSGGVLKELKAKGTDVLETGVKFALDHPEMRALQAELQKILRTKKSD